jgi:hypothetical protein
VGRTNFYLSNCQMYIPPWLLALGLLVLVCAMGATVVKSFRKFPEGFDDAKRIESVEAETGVKENYVEAQAPASAVKEAQAQDAQEPMPMASAAYVSANSSEGPEFESYLQQIKSRVSSTPTQANLDMISGGPEAPASETLVQGYLPNQERILPHETLPQRKPVMTANVHHDIGTGAEAIQNGAAAVRTVRENVREDGLRKQGFQSESAIQYVHS